MPIAKIVPGKAYPVAEIRDKFCNFLSPESFATDAQMVPVDITKRDPRKDTSNVFFSIKRLSTVLNIVIEDITFTYSESNGLYYKEKGNLKEEIDYATYRANTFMDEFLSIQ